MRLARPNNYLIANVTLWVVSYLATTGRVLLWNSMDFSLEIGVRRAIVTLIGVPLCALIGWVLLRVQTRPLSQRLVLSLLMSILAAFIYSAFNQLVFHIIAPKWGPATFVGLWEYANILVWVFLVWCAVHFAITYDAEARDKSLRLLAAQALASDAQNQMLRYQINPHFLFNTLNALSTLILAKDTAKAEQMVLSLSGFLRHSLEKELTDTITLREELEVQRLYLAIEQVRFGERLRFVDRVPGELLDAAAPSLILQPLVENAVKYGVAAQAGPVTIEIAARAEGSTLVLSVTDDGPGAATATAPGLGVGLRNVRRRLEAMYGAAAGIELQARDPHGFIATIRLPLGTR